MADKVRDWDKELAKIDRLMAAKGAAEADPPAKREPAPQPAAPAALPAAGRTHRLGVWGRVLLGVVLGAAVTQWPNDHACGVPLALYLGSVAVVLLAGGWGAVTAWQRRLAAPHIAALGLIGWGFALAAAEILPRIGYATEAASWLCR